ncbi:unnamed protein product [Lactuca saligna]|uniref:Uncharacterized protein n=1 Tax=Lactuca saligna TaxID=75948 RepID=A0AA35ZVZ3_LACSI|nr:unnamed protein product [Lactuca saligna]
MVKESPLIVQQACLVTPLTLISTTKVFFLLIPLFTSILINYLLRVGLRELRDEDDYVRFLDAGFDDDDNQISIHIDDYHEPLLDWIEEEKAEEGDSGTDTYEYDVDLVLSDDLSVDHEADDEDIQ